MAVIAALGVALLAAILLTRRPRGAIALWLAVMVFVPCWLSVHVVTTLLPQALAFIVILPAVIRTVHGRLSRVDLALLAFVVLAAIAYWAAGTPQYAFATIFAQWLPAYWVGRYLAPAAGREWVYRAVAIAAMVVGAWSIIEFTFDWHVFVNLTDSTSGWNKIQRRGPFARSEGAFGHSIAMGAFLALGLPFAISGQFRPVRRVLMAAIIVGGIVTTFSRGALIGAVVVLVASVLFLPGSSISKRTRGTFIAALTVLSATAVPAMLDLFSSVSEDLDPSTRYRENLTSHIFEDMRWLGPADAIQIASDGRYLYRGTGSIDNTFLLTVLQFGWLPTLFVLLALVGVSLRVISRRGGPADIAMFAQIFVMYTVALITQYGMALWFCAGLAVALGSRYDERDCGALDSTTLPKSVGNDRSLIGRSR